MPSALNVVSLFKDKPLYIEALKKHADDKPKEEKEKEATVEKVDDNADVKVTTEPDAEVANTTAAPRPAITEDATVMNDVIKGVCEMTGKTPDQLKDLFAVGLTILVKKAEAAILEETNKKPAAGKADLNAAPAATVVDNGLNIADGVPSLAELNARKSST